MNREISIAQIQDRIITFRGKQVMINRDLAVMYDVEGKRLNEEAKRNSGCFPDSFRFRLNKQEKNKLVEFDQFRDETAYDDCITKKLSNQN